MALSRTRIAALLFAFSAVGPLGKWLILLFAVVPPGQSALEHATQMFAYVFGDTEVRWFFAVLAVLPVLFAALCFVAWSNRTRAATAILGLVATVASLVVVWPVAITSAIASYYVYRGNAV